MSAWYLHARESFWFLPTLFAIGAVGLALGLIEIDRFLLENDGTSPLPLASLSASGGRAILTVIGGTMLGVAATSFSITISALATTSSTYGPRLVRNFMADRGNQVVLAVLTSTFLYTLVVLRAVRTEQDSTSAFVPAIAVSVAMLFAVADVAVLVYFIHHIASSVQVTTLQGRVYGDLMAAIDLLYPADPPRAARRPVDLALRRVVEAVRAPKAGYVQFVRLHALVERAQGTGTLIHVLTAPGSHVLEGQIIAHVLTGDEPVDEKDAERPRGPHATAVAGAFDIELSRTPQQDLRFAAQDLTETGIRGLATGSNDPYTAVTAIDALSVALVTLFTRPPAAGVSLGRDGHARVLCDWPSPAQVLGDVLLALRTYGMQHPLVVLATLRLMNRVAEVAKGENRVRLFDEVEALRAAYVRAEPASIDAEPVLQELDALRAELRVH